MLDYINRAGIYFFLLREGKKGKGGVSKIAAVITVPGLVRSRSTKKWLKDICQKKEEKKKAMGSLTMHQTHPRLKAN